MNSAGQLRLPISILLVAAAAILIAPLIAFFTWQGLELAEQERIEIEQAANRLAIEVRSSLDRTLTYYIAILNTLASSEEIDKEDLARLQVRATSALRPVGLHVLMRDLNGQQLFNTRVPFGTPLPVEKGFDDPVFETKMPYVSDLVMGAVAKKPVIGLSVPVLRDSELRYILTMSLEPHLLTDILNVTGMPEGWVTNIVDRKGVRVSRSEAHAEFVGRPMPDNWQPNPPGVPVLTTGPAGRPVMLVSLQSRISDWYVVVSTPERAITGRVTEAVTRFVASGLVFSLAAIVAVYLLGWYIVRSLERITSAAEAFGRNKPMSIKSSFLREAQVLGETLEIAAARRDQNEKQIRLLMGELNHRLRNLLMVIQVLVSQTDARNVKTFKERVISRLTGLAASQELILKGSPEGVDLRELVKAHISLYDAHKTSRFQIAGPPVKLSSQAAQSLGLAFHELGTNAGKYGALSGDAGTISVNWKVRPNDGESKLYLEWREQGGPPVKTPKHKGFGYKIMVEQAERALAAKVDLAFHKDGIAWSVLAPLDEISMKRGRQLE